MHLPLLYWPTTIAWVDDDVLFLQAAESLVSKQFAFTAFNNPTDALKFFNHYQALLPNAPLLKTSRASDEYGLSDHLPLDINMDAIGQVNSNPAKPREISIIVTDFHMPEMTGVELCRTLQSCPAKKILLTGMADHKQASDAFNEGIIDCFLRKDSPDLAKDLRQYIQKLSVAYFATQTSPLSHCLESDNALHISDPVFSQYLNEWKSRNDISEHYILDRHCNLGLKNRQGDQFAMVVHTDSTLNAFLDLYQNEPEFKTHLEQVANRKRIPWFGENTEGWQMDADQWQDRFYTPDIIEGREVYYISVVNE